MNGQSYFRRIQFLALVLCVLGIAGWRIGGQVRAANSSLPAFAKQPGLFKSLAAVGSAALVSDFAQQAYLKASNTGALDNFGQTVAISGDTLVVGSPLESSNATGVNGNQSDNSAGGAGAVYVFVRNGTLWTQQAYLKASNAQAADGFGFSVAISGDTIVVGALQEDSAATGVNGNQADNSAIGSGAAYVFVRNGTTWTQQAYLKASNTGSGDQFGQAVAIFGNIIVVGAPLEDSDATGVNGNQANENGNATGAAYVFFRNGTTWSQQAYLKASNAESIDNFGGSVAAANALIAVGAAREDSNATSVNGNQANNSAENSGAVYVFVSGDGNWAQQAYLKASNTGAGDFFGVSVAASGNTILVGATGEDSNATGVNGNQTNNSSVGSGAAYAFVRNGATWTQQAYLKASNTGDGDRFGTSVTLAVDNAVIGATSERSSATGVNGNQADNSADDAGAAYIFARGGADWAQRAYLKASNSAAGDLFGISVGIVGETVVVGAHGEDGNATGVNGDQANDGASNSGAVYVFAIPQPCSTVTVVPAALPNATVNTPYPTTLTAQPAAPYTFAVTNGLLPQGLTLNGNGTFGGAPLQSGVFNFRVTATSAEGCTGFQDYVLLVNCPAITVNPFSLSNGTVGFFYQQSVSAAPAGTYVFSVTSGALPIGLTLNAATGSITGIPTIIGTFNFRITAGAGGCNGFNDYSVTISDCPEPPVMGDLPNGTAGTAYNHTIQLEPAGVYSFTLVQGNLPSGFTLNPLTGTLAGLTNVAGTYNFAIKAQAPSGCNVTKIFALVIGCPTVAVAPASLPNGTPGAAYNQQLSAGPAGGNFTFSISAGALPVGLTLNPATGVISGTPSQSITANFTVTATGFGSCTGTRAYTLVIGNGGGCANISLPSGLPNGAVGQLYSQSVAASPAGTYSYAVTAGALPPGVSLFGQFGLLNGFPGANGTFNFTIQATDANGCVAGQSYSVLIGVASAVAFNDFSGDRRGDFVLWRAAQSQWLIVDSAGGTTKTEIWGNSTDLPVAGDYDGDGKSDVATFGKDGVWRVKQSGGGTTEKLWGLGSDVPVPGDYDGDGKTDIAVWRGDSSHWFIVRSSDGQTQVAAWGSSRAPYLDVAVPADYDGDGKTDLAVFRTSNGHWYVLQSSDGKVVDKFWGLGTDVPVPADYDGDGKTDIAVWRGEEGNWYIRRSSDQTVEVKFWGTSAAPYFDAPVPADYDGDGKVDAAVWRAAERRWYVLQSSDGAARSFEQGRAGDRPVVSIPRK